MLMAELSRRSGVRVATIKYYLREGLLPPGTATAATRAEYGEEHLRRLRLIRALVEIGEVPIASIRDILAAVDDGVSAHDLMGAVQYSLAPVVTDPPDNDEYWQAASREVDELLETLNWNVMAEAPARTMLIAARAAALRTGAYVEGASLRDYAEAAGRLAKLEVAGVMASADAASDRLGLAESALVGIVLSERVLIALRRLAQEDVSARLNASDQAG
jgi:DNA-binding transcriptional MerR regulator